MNSVRISEKKRVELTRDWVLAICGGIRYLGLPVLVKEGEEVQENAPAELILSPIYEVMRTQDANTRAIGKAVMAAEMMTGEGLRGCLVRPDVVFSFQSVHDRDLAEWQSLVDNAEEIRMKQILHMARLAHPKDERPTRTREST